MNSRAIGCGTLAIVVFVAVGLFGMSLAFGQMEGCPDRLQWGDRAYLPVGVPAAEPSFAAGAPVKIGSTFIGLTTRQVWGPPGSAPSQSAADRPDQIFLDCADGSVRAYEVHRSASEADGSSTPTVAVSGLAGRLAFSFDSGIWVSRADGSDPRQVTDDGGFDPDWSPDGTWITYRILGEHDDGEIWIVRADGTDRRDLVNDPRYSDWGPAWSPDGKSIAFNSNRTGILALWVMNADGSNQRMLTQGHGEYPAWSPDGQQIVYAGGAYYDIRIVNADGSDDHPITTGPAYEMAPAWSPDGSWIAYETQADYYPDVSEPGMGSEMEIHLIRPDGSGDRRITFDEVEDYFPAWSPDGRVIIWSRHGELVVADLAGEGMAEVRPGNFPDWIP